MHSYLGMQLVFENGRVKVDMTYYLEKVLKEFDDLMSEVLPGKKNLFASSLESPMLLEKDKASFHTVAVKLLYLSRRARSDIIPAVRFLCTRVQRSTEEDNMKLKRLLGYLLKTRKQILVLQPLQSFKVVAYINASFAIHSDGKSHTRIMVFVAGVAVHCALQKQKRVSKSPTEAELVALSDNLGFVELFHEFVSFLVNDKIKKPLIYQDNTLVISMVTNGGGITRTKHMRTWMFLVLESLKEQRVAIRYIHTSGIIADGL